MKRPRRYFSPQDKLAALRRHLVEKTPISDLCDELGIQPTLLYQWQKQLFENGAAAFAASARKDGQDKRIARLEEKLRDRNEVVAELMEDHVRLKKELGDN